MADIFLDLMNVSITASWVVLAVLVLRLCLKKAPKWITCLLWGVVGLRLVLPVSIESSLSLIPSTQVIPGDIGFAQNPAIHSGISAVDKVVNPVISQTFAPQGLVSVNPLQITMGILAIVWLVGMGVMVLYGVISTVRLSHTVRASVCVRENIYICDTIDTPFILGVFRPRIYLPSGMTEEQMEAVIAHERSHLRRKDHWWKPLGYALLTVYWFNPVLWLAYILLCRDIELACDEAVIKTMDAAGKKQYSQTLVDCSSNQRRIIACPLAFGEVGVKARIKAVLNYKKPAFWIIAVALAASAVLVVCFLTDPKPCEHVYTGKITLEPTCTGMGVETFTCENCFHSYTQPVAMKEHAYEAGAVLTVPTCTKTGIRELACRDCGGTTTEEMAVTPHTYGTAFVTKEPNCSDQGEKSAVCTECEGTFVVEYLPTNDVHEMKQEVVTAATCAAAGEGKNTCSRCNHTETVTLEKLEHSYTKKMELPATCARGGQKQMVCDNCGKEQWLDTPIDPDAHNWVYMGFYWPEQCMWCHRTKSENTRSSNTSVLDGVLYEEEDEPLFPVVKWDIDPRPIVEFP